MLIDIPAQLDPDFTQHVQLLIQAIAAAFLFSQRFFKGAVRPRGLFLALQTIVKSVHHAGHLHSIKTSSVRYSGTEKRRVLPGVWPTKIGYVRHLIETGRRLNRIGNRRGARRFCRQHVLGRNDGAEQAKI